MGFWTKVILTILVQAVLIVLKLTGVLAISTWIILIPLYLLVGVCLIVWIMYLICKYFGG